MLFRGSDTMTSLPSIHGRAHGDDVVAVAVRVREAGLFTDGFTKLLVRVVRGELPLAWIDQEDFLPSTAQKA
jgi:hypothetical protein